MDSDRETEKESKTPISALLELTFCLHEFRLSLKDPEKISRNKGLVRLWFVFAGAQIAPPP